eukprot:TRINITY_DN1539_c0_g3_i1.p1 TRINITY_DN1539_c0_g3~~TRINITY_DN1539_c0_g3_i1.p1  ORF type:complete len:243 (+),score=54.27 TRINITY_DN1539_c0_g3_i1:107-835(+)
MGNRDVPLILSPMFNLPTFIKALLLSAIFTTVVFLLPSTVGLASLTIPDLSIPFTDDNFNAMANSYTTPQLHMFIYVHLVDALLSVPSYCLAFFTAASLLIKILFSVRVVPLLLSSPDAVSDSEISTFSKREVSTNDEEKWATRTQPEDLRKGSTSSNDRTKAVAQLSKFFVGAAILLAFSETLENTTLIILAMSMPHQLDGGMAFAQIGTIGKITAALLFIFGYSHLIWRILKKKKTARYT